MKLTFSTPVFTGKKHAERPTPEQLMERVRKNREKSPGMDSLYEIVDGVIDNKAKDWTYQLDPKKGDTLTCSISGKDYALKRVNAGNGKSVYFVDVEKEDHKTETYPVAKRAYDKVLDKIRRFIDVANLSKESLMAIRFKLHINPETHKRQLPIENEPKGMSAGALHKEMRANSPSYDPGKDNINNLLNGLYDNKARIVVFEKDKLALCLLNQIHYKLEAQDGNYSLSVNTFGKKPLVFALSKRIFDQVMAEIAEAKK